MGAVVKIFDRLTNIMSGKGTTADRRVYEQYSFVPINPQQAEAAYRSSWLVRKIIDVPPFDMTREWRDWQAEATAIEKLEAEERRLQLKAKCQRALVLARLYGGGALFLGTKDMDPEQPLNIERISGGGLTYVHVLSRHQLSEGSQRMDPADPWFGLPEYFTLNAANGQQLKLHPSRIVAFIGQRAPEGSLMPNGSWFWGDPIMPSIEQAVKNADLAQDGFAALIDEAKLDILKIPGLTAQAATPDYETRLTARLSAAKVGQSVWRAKILDADEEWDQFQVTWAGMPDIITAYLNCVAGAADIPVTRLLGQSPKGLQSTGDGEERDYQSMVRARQNELLCPALDQVDELMIRSALGSKPSDVYYEFAPLSQMDEKDAATIEKQRADTVKVYADSGLIPDVALSAMAKNSIIESGRWPGSEKAFEEAANEPLPNDQQNEGDLQTLEQRLSAMESKGAITPVQKDALLTDAAARTLYVQRKLINSAAFIKWAKEQGFTTTTPADELHVTICFSRTPVDWMKVSSAWSQNDKGQMTIPPGGARLVERLGDKGAVVLLFNASELSWRHEEIMRAGASHDFENYQPHITITYQAPEGLDLEKVEPYRGELVFGPEIFEEVNDDWAAGLTEDE